MTISPNTNIYFISDFHFGVPDHASSLLRERRFISFLDSITDKAAAIYLMGDLFDFWFEYRTVVPKGFARLQGKLAEITDAGIPVHLFRGNHDVWAFDYLNTELGIHIHRDPEITSLGGATFFLSHGDGYGPGDQGYKFLKSVFASPFNQWLFRWVHPDWGTRLGLYFSHRSRVANVAREGVKEEEGDPRRERLFLYAMQQEILHPEVDYFVFGHRHRPLDLPLQGKARCIILGDWVTHFSYAVYNGEDLRLEFFTG